MSAYLLLQRREAEPDVRGLNVWTELGTFEATSAEGAVRAYIEREKSDGGGVFLAVPQRSSKAVRVAVEQVRKVSVGAVDAPNREEKK